MELALRFVLLRKLPQEKLSTVGNIGDFLTAEIISFVEYDDERLNEESQVFKTIFRVLHEAGGSDTLRRLNSTRGRSEGPFSLTAFEAISLGLGFHLPGKVPSPDMVREKREILWSHNQFSAGHATGIRADQRMKSTIPFGRQLFSS
jgi:hypothetical protein